MIENRLHMLPNDTINHIITFLPIDTRLYLSKITKQNYIKKLIISHELRSKLFAIYNNRIKYNKESELEYSCRKEYRITYNKSINILMAYYNNVDNDYTYKEIYNVIYIKYNIPNKYKMYQNLYIKIKK